MAHLKMNCNFNVVALFAFYALPFSGKLTFKLVMVFGL